MILSVQERTFAKEVLQVSTPVLVYFWAPWCGLCRLIEPLLVQFEQDSGGEVKLFGLNADESLKLANTYRLKTLPTLILFHQGEIIHRWEHFRGREDLRQMLNLWQINCQEQSTKIRETSSVFSQSS